jgi:FtsH-binding integral membrane protein
MKLKSFSVELLVSAIKDTAVRFPLPVLCCLFITTLLTVIIESNSAESKYHLMQIVLSATLALPLLLAITTTSETRGLKQTLNWGLQCAAVILSVLYFFSLPDNISESAMARHSLLVLIAISLLSFLPFCMRPLQNGYWQFNKTIIFRILSAVLFTGVLFAGISIAMMAGNELFDLKIDGERYGQLWVILGCFVAPMFVFAGTPKPLVDLEQNREYPKPLKVFAQYILLPLVGLYLVILYLYEMKIVAQWSWPNGWVSLLVIWYAAVGLSSLLILWPLRNLEENRWINRFTTWFFYLLIPLIVMLFLAIKVRIGDYGLTVNRYLVVALAVWLTLVVLYFIFSKIKDIRAIPITVIIVALLASYGPLSAWSASEKSQLGRLAPLLEKQKATETTPVDSKEKMRLRGEMSSIIEYLSQWHGVESLTGVVADSLLAKYNENKSYDNLDIICQSLGFQYLAHWESAGESGHFNISTATNSLVYNADSSYFMSCSINLFDSHNLDVDSSIRDIGKIKGVHGGDTCIVGLTDDGQTLLIEIASPAFLGRDTATVDLAGQLELRELLVNTREISADSTQFFASGKYVDARFVANHISGEIEDSTAKINWMSGYLFISRR